MQVVILIFTHGYISGQGYLFVQQNRCKQFNTGNTYYIRFVDGNNFTFSEAEAQNDNDATRVKPQGWFGTQTIRCPTISAHVFLSINEAIQRQSVRRPR